MSNVDQMLSDLLHTIETIFIDKRKIPFTLHPSKHRKGHIGLAQISDTRILPPCTQHNEAIDLPTLHLASICLHFLFTGRFG